MEKLKTLKIHFIEILYTSLIDKSFESANNFLVRIILNSDESLYKYKKYLEVLSKISSLIINGYILTKYNANFSEYILNFIFMETKSFLKISENKKKLILYLLLNYGLPLIIELMKTLYNYFIPGYQSQTLDYSSKIFNKIKIILVTLDFLIKVRYLVQDKFIYYSLVDYALRLMIVNQGGYSASNESFIDVNKSLSLFFLYFFLKFGEWYYSKDENDSSITELPPPKRKLNLKSNICQICFNQIIDPVMLKCCGTVFCENCIANFIKLNKNCPISKDKILADSLVKLYD